MLAGLYGADAMAFVMIFVLRPSLVNLLTAILLIYVIQVSLTSYMFRRTEVRMLEQLDDALSDIRHFYLSSKDITAAIWSSMDKADKVLKPHMEEIYAVLCSSDMEMAYHEYNEKKKNKYIRLLLGICVKTVEQGDSYDEHGQSIFSENVVILKKDIRREIEVIRKTDLVFSGLTFVAAAPIVSLELVKGWALANVEELGNFYTGKGGFYVTILSFVITFIIFQTLDRLKNPDEIFQKNHTAIYWLLRIGAINRLVAGYVDKLGNGTVRKQALLKRLGERHNVKVLITRQMLYGLICLITGIAMFVCGALMERRVILGSISGIYDGLPNNIKNILKIDDVDEWARAGKGSVKDEVDLLIDKDSISEKDYLIISNMADTMDERLDKAGGEYLKWYELLVIIGMAVLFYHYPYLLLIFKKQFLDDYMAIEVMNFQTIISMQIKLKGVNLLDLLESMEMFANIFKPSIRTCINDMVFDEEKALGELKERERFPPFVRLVDCFLISDLSGIQTAFDEVVDDIRHFQDIYTLDVEVMLKRKGNVAEVAAFIPGMFMLMFYLVVPFVIAGMVLFETAFYENMGGM